MILLARLLGASSLGKLFFQNPYKHSIYYGYCGKDWFHQRDPKQTRDRGMRCRRTWWRGFIALVCYLFVQDFFGTWQSLASTDKLLGRQSVGVTLFLPCTALKCEVNTWSFKLELTRSNLEYDYSVVISCICSPQMICGSFSFKKLSYLKLSCKISGREEFKYLRTEYINMRNSLTFYCYLYILAMFCVASGCVFISTV